VKRVVEAVEQGSQRVEGHGTVPGLDENLRRHSRNDLDPVGFGDARILHPDLGRIVWLVGALIEETIGGDLLETGCYVMVERYRFSLERLAVGRR